ncbi:MAG: chaperone modulator CbpM [Phycisphaerae bacterium]
MSEPETYSVREAAETLGVTDKDVESYVEEGLVAEARGEDGSPVFTRAQMRRLWSVVTLHRDLGINLPGVAAVLRLREQFERMRRDLATLVEIVERELGPNVWDRLWPEGRPRPAADVSVEGVSDMADSADGDRKDGPGADRPGGEGNP